MDRNERLHRIVAQVAPSQAGALESGEWGPTGCPYVIETTTDNGRRVRVTDPESGDAVGASGTDLNDALAKLEAKVGLSDGGA